MKTSHGYEFHLEGVSGESLSICKHKTSVSLSINAFTGDRLCVHFVPGNIVDLKELVATLEEIRDVQVVRAARRNGA